MIAFVVQIALLCATQTTLAYVHRVPFGVRLTRSPACIPHTKYHAASTPGIEEFTDDDFDITEMQDDADAPTDGFGSEMPMMTITEAKSELQLWLQRHNVTDQQGTAVNHNRIQTLVQFLESTYLPILTTSFMSMVIDGEWNLRYSSLVKKQEDELAFNVHQEILSNEEFNGGSLANKINYEWKEGEGSCTGILTVKCDYTINPKGGYEIQLQDHELRPNDMPKDVEKLVQSLQASVPFEIFDPNASTMVTTFVDPDTRIVRVLSEEFPPVVNVFTRGTGNQDDNLDNSARAQEQSDESMALDSRSNNNHDNNDDDDGGLF